MKYLLIVNMLLFQLALPGQQVPQPKIIAYYTGNGTLIRQYPIHQLTHIIYSFLSLHGDTLGFKDHQQRLVVQQLVTLKKDYPHLKVMVSIGGWGGCAPCSGLFASPLHRQTFAKTTVQLLKQYNIDGLDLDWEYPVIEGYPGHPYDTADKSHFTELVKDLRKEMGKDYLLSFAAGGFTGYLEQSIDWNTVLPLVDFVNLMTYDLVNGYSKTTGHHTPLRGYLPNQESTEKCVNWLLAKKAAPAQLIIGAAFYARVWKEVADKEQGLYQTGQFLRSVSFNQLPAYRNDSVGFTYYWDKKAKAPYEYNNRKKLFFTYDNERSIAEKVKFIQSKKLGGIMFWELSEDLTGGGLVGAIWKGFNK
jgi:chitinase